MGLVFTSRILIYRATSVKFTPIRCKNFKGEFKFYTDDFSIHTDQFIFKIDKFRI